MLKQFSHSALTSQELIKTSERLIQSVTNSEHKTVLENRIRKTTEAGTQLVEALNQSLSSIHASKVQQADLDRDDAFQAFKYGVLSASFRSDFKVIRAGENLVEIVRKHGFNLYNLGYIAQSEAMEGLFKELEYNSDEVANARMADALEEMVRANAEFNRIFHEKVMQSNDDEAPQIVARKAELSKQITLFLNHVELLEEDKFGGVQELVSRINAVITGMMEEAKERK